MCQHIWCKKCPSLSDDYYNFQDYDKEDLPPTFPPRDDPAPETSAHTSRSLPLGPESPEGEAGIPSAISTFEFGELTDRFDYAAGMDNVNLGYSSDVNVPPGWKMISSNMPTVTEYFDHKYKFDISLNIVRHNLTHKRGKQARFGFKPEELISSGALQTLGPLPNNLTIPIHPLLQRDNWHNTPDEIFKFLEPALRLASCFFREPLACQWWCTWRYGHREVDSQRVAMNGVPVQYISKAVENSEANCVEVIEHLHKLGTITAPGEGRLLSIRWYGDSFVWEEEEDIELRTACGYMAPRLLSRHPFSAGHQYLRVGISMHKNFYIAADRLMNTKNPDPDIILRFNLFFMVTLLHEVSHALGTMDMYRGKTRPSCCSEVEFDGLIENGFHWEQCTFGGIIHPINSDFSMKYGLSIDTFSDRSKDSSDPSKIFYTVPMSYVEKLQQQEFWDSLDAKRYRLTPDERWRYFYVDRSNSARAWGQPWVCTADPADIYAELWDDIVAEKVSKLKKEAYDLMTPEQKDNASRIQEAQEIEKLRIQRRQAWQLRQKLVAERKMKRQREASGKENWLGLSETIQQPAEFALTLRPRPARESKQEADAFRRRSRSPHRSPPLPPPSVPENHETETEEERARREYAWEEYRRSQKRQRDQAYLTRLQTLEEVHKAEKTAREHNEYYDFVTGELTERPVERARARGMWQPRPTERDREMEKVSDLLEASILPKDILTRDKDKLPTVCPAEEYDISTDGESVTDASSEATTIVQDLT